MYAVVRRYHSSDVPEIARRATSGFVPIVKDVPGFVAYHLVADDEGTIATITVCEDRHGALQSTAAAADWVRENLIDLVDGPPEITAGEVLVSA